MSNDLETLTLNPSKIDADVIRRAIAEAERTVSPDILNGESDDPDAAALAYICMSWLEYREWFDAHKQDDLGRWVERD